VLQVQLQLPIQANKGVELQCILLGKMCPFSMESSSHKIWS